MCEKKETTQREAVDFDRLVRDFLNEIEPCWWCGGRCAPLLTEPRHGDTRVVCTTCGAQSVGSISIASAIENHNKGPRYRNIPNITITDPDKTNKSNEH